MLTIFQFPRDINGLIPGKWRLRHVNDVFSGHLAHIDFIGGVSQRALEGLELQRFVIAYGEKLQNAEPWEGGPRIGSDSKSRDEVISIAATAVLDDAEELKTHAVPPPIEVEASEKANGFAPAPEDEYDVMAKPDLQDLAEAKGLDFDRRWGAPRLREFLREADNVG